MTAEEQAWEDLFEWLADVTVPPGCYVAEYWDPAKHPRTNAPPNAGWFASTDGGDNSDNTGAGHLHAPTTDTTSEHPANSSRTRDAILNDLHAVNRALKQWKESAQNAWFIGPSQAEKQQLLDRMRQLLDELEPHLNDQELVNVAAWRGLQNASKKMHDRLKNIFTPSSIHGDYRSAEEIKDAERERRFHHLLAKNANQWWRMTNAERFELQQEITARAEAYRDKYHDEEGYSFFMRQLDKLVNPAWRGMGNLDDLLTLMGGVSPAIRSGTSRLPLNTRPDIVSVRPAPPVATQPLWTKVAPRNAIQHRKAVPNLDKLPNHVLARVRRGDVKGRAFGTPRNPRMPTIAEFNPRIVEIRAGDLETTIKERRHPDNPQQAHSVRQLHNDSLLEFKMEDPISAVNVPNGISLTGGHHRTTEIIRRVKEKKISPDVIIQVLTHE